MCPRQGRCTGLALAAGVRYRARMRVLSGIQPSGRLHIGNYFGALRQHLDLQLENETFYFIANYHALTSIRNPEELRRLTADVALDYLALGLNPEKATLFRQSDVPQVTELSWILSCVTPMGLLERAVSYKDKVAQGLSPNHGLFAYPVLQAADILIYLSEVVPVGQDQKQHIEITRDIATKFNNEFEEIFVVPEARILESTAVVPGTDGRKMSKSYGNEIGIFEGGKSLKKKVMSIVTDSTPVEAPKDPETSTPFLLLRLLADPEETAEWEARYKAGGMGYGEVKKRLLELLNVNFGPYREKREALARDPDYVEDVLREGGRRARSIALPVMEQVRRATGIQVSYGRLE
ncbi:MAG: tryptophan--tRNA ligase [Thermoleophilia bacterium]